uniref:NADH-ubiquinone oxidoreductase chain 4L n=1 Tax=Paracaecilius japanus TaxID=297965 RepID=A0A8K1ZG49_9NEOP|nr:NADH dehydrogenase subunit 4L [Paracaecilius japanus]
MLMNIYIIFFFMFMVGMYSFYLKSDHLLNMLLSLEFVSLILFMVFSLMIWMNLEKFILIYFLTFCVCEGAFGLSLLVNLARSFGNDYLQNLSILKC